MATLWKNRETTTQSPPNLPSSTVVSNQKKRKRIRSTSTTRRYSQRIREQKEKNAITQSNVLTSLPYHSKQVSSSANQDSCNLTTLQAPSNLASQTNNNILNDMQQMFNDTKADVQIKQSSSSELMIVPPHLHAADIEEEPDKEENEAGSTNAYHIPEPVVFIEQCTFSSDDDNDKEEVWIPLADQEEVWTHLADEEEVWIPLADLRHNETVARKKRRRDSLDDTECELSNKEKRLVRKRRKMQKRIKNVWIEDCQESI